MPTCNVASRSGAGRASLGKQPFRATQIQWIPFVVLAVVAHIAIQEIAPVLAGSDGAELNLPPIMEESFWVNTGVVALGYLIVIGVFFLIKSLLFRKSAAAH